MKYAPILIPTLSRYNHFKRCIDSLANNILAKETELYIALDFPLHEKHWNGYKKIIKFIDNINGFKSVNLIKREKNFGASLNIKEGRKAVFQIHDRIIFSEDDNEFSPNFLEYINLGLEKYEFDQGVSAVCGYKHYIELPEKYNDNYFFYKGFSAWGYATWRNKPIKTKYTTNELKSFIQNKEYILELNNISARHYNNILESIVKNENRIGDFAVFLSNIERKQSCVFPSISKVRNHGYDGSGINCGLDDSGVFVGQEIDHKSFFNFSNGNVLLNNSEINKLYKLYFNFTFKSRIKGLYFRFLFLIRFFR